MEARKCLPLRRAEISLNNFNSVAIPHHLDLLSKHKDNIYKYHKSGDISRIKGEQINATRVIIQLKHLLEEMDSLRQQIIEKDLKAFDQLTEKSRKNTISAINEYIVLSQALIKSDKSSSWNNSNEQFKSNNENETARSYGSLQSFKNSPSLDACDLQEQISCLKSWDNLQEEVKDIHELFVKLEGIINTQAEPVRIIDENIVTADNNVEVGRRHLSKAEYFKTKWYPLAGAAVGCCIAGPVGLLTGLKIGGLALLGGSALGYTGGKLLKNKTLKKLDSDSSSSDNVSDKKKS